jgi:hypothetical protein
LFFVLFSSLGVIWSLSTMSDPILVRPVEPQPVIPPGYRRMAQAEVTADLEKVAPSFLSQPFGTVLPVTNSEGLDVIAAIEQHFHPVNGPAKPWGWHKGVSLYIRDFSPPSAA